MRRIPTVLLAVAAILVSLLGTASADQAATARPANPGWAVTTLSAQALSCGGGNMCAWPVIDGSSSRCSWGNSDNDWWNAPVTCSWSSSRGVKAIFNNGTSTTYDGVCFYRGANQNPATFEVWVPQGGTATNSNESGVILRSHKWVRPEQSC